MHRIEWRHKKSGVSKIFVNNAAYFPYRDSGKVEFFVQTVDFNKFCNNGDIGTNRQELAAFLANISHETSANAPYEQAGDKNTQGLYWREEEEWQKGSNSLGYVDDGNAGPVSVLYRPTANQSYHGRGPIQLTHNKNYGQFSEIIYGDKQILLDNPNLVVPNKPEDGTIAFMSAIWFWMMPQAPKPSCHDVMSGDWIPSSDDIAKNRHTSKLGMTINIINGIKECGSAGNSAVESRKMFYKAYIAGMGEAEEGVLGCHQMTSY
ncbi:MAG: hypothetical protein GY786_06825 [Proteobacteria bacterium]|nr:hypothetical protein [Pseudomonadota bacterium]